MFNLISITFKSLLFLFLFMITSKMSFAQRSGLQIQAGISATHINHPGCNLEDKTIHRGYSGGLLSRISYQRNRFYVLSGVNIDNVISDHRKYPFNINIPISVQYDLIVRRKTSFFAETGFDLYLYKSWWSKKIHVIPIFSDLFLGHRLSVSRNFDLITKLKIPGISLLTDGFGTFNFIEKGIEFLLAYRIPMTGKARIKSIPCSPF